MSLHTFLAPPAKVLFVPPLRPLGVLGFLKDIAVSIPFPSPLVLHSYLIIN